MKSTHPRRIISVSVSLLTLITASSIPSASAQNYPMQDSPMQQNPMQRPMQDSPMQQNPMLNRSQGSSLNGADRQFMVKAAQSDMTEIQTSQLALKRSRNSQVRQFAQQMIQQHTDSSSKLKPLAAQKRVMLPKDLGVENQSMLTRLSRLSGTRFDQEYMSGQTQAHKKTQAFYQTELQQGQDADVKAFASQVLPVVTAHLQMAQSMTAGR